MYSSSLQQPLLMAKCFLLKVLWILGSAFQLLYFFLITEEIMLFGLPFSDHSALFSRNEVGTYQNKENDTLLRQNKTLVLTINW